MPDDDLSIRHQIDLICDRFESAQQAGEDPDLAAYLGELDEAAAATLFEELLKLVVDYNQKHGRPTDRYAMVRSFPEFRSIINRLVPDVDATIDSVAEGKAKPDELGRTVGPDMETMAAGVGARDSNEGPTVARGAKVKYVGDYEIIDEIARGGMGVVYRAKQSSLNRTVALKMILSGELAGDEEVARFRSEAEAAANLDHPAIVPIYEVGQHQDQHYFSMGLIEGPSLSEVLRDGPMDTQTAVNLVRQLADAIGYAHQRGVIHRDLKPGNILLSDDGAPHITDFGLAKRTTAKEELTTTGQILGTPSYMPPEQARGDLEKIGPASDIYSLGAILYSILSGRPPHNAGSAIETLRQVVEVEPLSVRALNPSIPRDLETICAKCLDKEPTRRYEAASELAEELSRFLRGEPIHARPVSRIERCWRWAKRRPALAALSAAVLLLTATLAVGGPLTAITQTELRRRAEANQQRANLLAESEREARESVEASQVALAAEKERGDHALYARTVSLAHQQWQAGNLISAEDMLASLSVDHRGFEWHYVDSLCHQELHQFTGLAGNPRLAAMTPDQQHVLVSEPGDDPKLRIFQVGSNQPIAIRPIAVIACAKDGSKLAVVDAKKLGTMRIIEPITGRVLSEFDCDRRVTSYASFGGPDDSLLAVSCTDRTVRVLDTSSGEELLSIDEPNRRQLHHVALSPDGKTIAWRRSDDGAIEIRDTTDGSVRYEGPTSLLRSVYPVAFSRDGASVTFGGFDVAQVVRTEDGKTIGFLDGLRGSALSVAYAPDGERIAVTCEDGIVRVYDAKQMRLLTRLIGHKAGAVYGILSVTFDASGDRIISCGADGAVKVWDAWSGDHQSIGLSGRPREELPSPSQEVDYITVFRNRVEGVRISDDGKLLLAASRDDSVRVFDATTDELVREWTSIGEHMSSVDHSAAKDMVVGGGGSITDKERGSVIAWSLSSGEELWRYEGARGAISKVEFFKDDSRIAVSVGSQAMSTGELFVLDARTGELVWNGDSIFGPVEDFAVSHDSTWIASVGQSQGVNLHDAESGKWQGRTDGTVYRAVAISRDGERIAVGSRDWQVLLIDRESGDPLWSSLRHYGSVMAIAFAENDSRIISTGVDGTTRVWDSTYGDLLLTMEDTGSEKYDVAVSGSGDLIASVGRDASIKIRRLKNRLDVADPDSWVTLMEDAFDRDEIGDGWSITSGQWAIEQGALVGTLKPSTNLPGTNEAMIGGTFVFSSDVEVSYDAEIDSPMMLQTILGESSAKNMLIADYIGVGGTHLNYGSVGASVCTMARGDYREIASRRGGGFEFETGRTYRFTVRRVGTNLELIVDGELYRAVEVGVDVPIPLLFLQPIFGNADARVSIDSLIVKVPPDSIAEVQATRAVSELFKRLQLKPLVVNEIRGMGLEELSALAKEEAGVPAPDAEQVREEALRLASSWPEEDGSLISQAAALAAAGELTPDQYRDIYKWIDTKTPVKTEEILLVQGMAAFRAGDLSEARGAVQEAGQRYASQHGTAHPVELTLQALISNQSGDSERAIEQIRGARQLALADRWKNDDDVTSWIEIATESIQPPEFDSVAATLSNRVWEIDTERMLRSNPQPLADALAENAVYISRRTDEDDEYTMTVPRDRWLATDQLWNSTSSVGVHLIRSSAEVDLNSDDPVVTSRYAFEIPRMFFTYLQRDTFQRDPSAPADQWKIIKREARVTKWFLGGTTYDTEHDGWEQIDALVEQAKESDSLVGQVKALTVAGCPAEAFELAEGLRKEPDSAIQLTAVVEAAFGAYQPDSLRDAAVEAIRMDPMVGVVPVIRRIAAEELAPDEPQELRSNISVRPPTFYREAPVQLLGGGPNGVAAWQPTQESLVGIYLHPGLTLETMEENVLASRAGALNATLLDSREATVDGFRAKHLVHAGTGIGRAMALQGKPTMQRFTLIQRDNDLIALLVSSYSDDFIFRDTEFKYFLETIKLK